MGNQGTPPDAWRCTCERLCSEDPDTSIRPPTIFTIMKVFKISQGDKNLIRVFLLLRLEIEEVFFVFSKVGNPLEI